MKIRFGFVSNSSSTSFCIYGIRLDSWGDGKLDKIKEKFNVKDNYDLGEMFQEKGGLEYSTGPEGDCLYLGLSWDSIKDDETGKEFKERVSKKIEELLGEKFSCSTFTEGWYNG